MITCRNSGALCTALHNLLIVFFPCKEQDWGELVPETERLDTSAHKAKGLLAQKAKRQPPSRSKLKESLTIKPSPSQVSR